LLAYSSATAYIVIVALAEELLAILLVISLLGMSVSAIEMTLSLKPNRIGPETRIAVMTRGFFASTTSRFNYTRRYIVNTNFSGEIVSNDKLCFLLYYEVSRV
jgi:hypothetical protein